jgi:hypothetical protein
MSAEAREGGTGRRTVFIIVAVVIVFLLLVIGSCSGLIYFAIRAFSPMLAEMQHAQEAGNRFLTEIGAGRIEDAYHQTTANFQKGQSLDEFRKMIDHYPTLKNSASVNVRSYQFNQSGTAPVVTLDYTVMSKDKWSTGCGVQLEKEGEAWKVDKLTLPP